MRGLRPPFPRWQDRSVEFLFRLQNLAGRRIDVVFVVEESRFEFDFVDHDAVLAVEFAFEVADFRALESCMGKSRVDGRFIADVFLRCLAVADLGAAARSAFGLGLLVGGISGERGNRDTERSEK